MKFIACTINWKFYLEGDWLMGVPCSIQYWIPFSFFHSKDLDRHWIHTTTISFFIKFILRKSKDGGFNWNLKKKEDRSGVIYSFYLIALHWCLSWRWMGGLNERDGVKEVKGRGRTCRVKDGWLKERVVGTWQMPVGTANYSEWMKRVFNAIFVWTVLASRIKIGWDFGTLGERVAWSTNPLTLVGKPMPKSKWVGVELNQLISSSTQGSYQVCRLI